MSLLSLLIYWCWRKKQIVHRERLCELLKQKRLRHPQGLLLKRRRMYEQNIEYLQAELEVQPNSPKIIDQLRVALEGLHFIERYLASFPSGTLTSNHFRQEQLLVEDAMAASVGVVPANSGRGCWRVLINSAYGILFGAPEEEDFAEELQMLSQYDDCPLPTASLLPRSSKQIRSQTEQDPSGPQRSLEKTQASSDPVSRQYSSLVSDQISTEEYNNPLYNPSPTIAVSSIKKTVSFSPVNEVFEGSDLMSRATSDDSNISPEENTEDLSLEYKSGEAIGK